MLSFFFFRCASTIFGSKSRLRCNYIFHVKEIVCTENKRIEQIEMGDAKKDGTVREWSAEETIVSGVGEMAASTI